MYIREQIWPEFSTYLTIDRKLSNKPASYLPNKSRFKKIAKWFVNREFNRGNINIFLGDMMTNKSKPSYMNKMVTILKHLDKYLKVNEMADYTYFRESIEHKETLTPEEIVTIANATPAYSRGSAYLIARQTALIMLLGTTGCRIGEALNLKWVDIGSEPPYVVFTETKNGETRVVPIDKTIYDQIMALPRKSEYVFCSVRGNQLQHQEFNLDLKSRAILVGIKKNISAHTFRHSYVTTMMELGVDSLDIAHIVGHKDPKTTMRYQNSHLAYYSEVAQLHPLLRGSLSIDQIAKRTLKYVSRIADSRSYQTTFSQNGDEINFSIKRI